MIRNINAGSHLQITNAYVSDPYISPNNDTMTGIVRYTNNQFEVYDGNMNTWHKIGQAYPMISLTESATKAIDWAVYKMSEEENLKSLSNAHPSIKAAYENMKQSAEKLKITILLSQDEKLETNR